MKKKKTKADLEFEIKRLRAKLAKVARTARKISAVMREAETDYPEKCGAATSLAIQIAGDAAGRDWYAYLRSRPAQTAWYIKMGMEPYRTLAGEFRTVAHDEANARRLASH